MIDRLALIEDLKKIIVPVLMENNVELVEFDIVHIHGGMILKLLVDKKEGGINLDECAGLNERIGAILDAENIISDRYVLEVSSPGIDRPLKTKNDFLRCINREAVFFLKEPLNGKLELKATIKKVENEHVYLGGEGRLLEIPISKINRAKQVI